MENLNAIVLDITKSRPILDLMNKETLKINNRLKSEMVFGLAENNHLYFQQIMVSSKRRNNF